MLEELDTEPKKIKSRKATSVKEIPPEVWKIRKFFDIFLRLCSIMYKQNTTASFPSPKKGGFEIPKNYSCISLIAIVV